MENGLPPVHKGKVIQGNKLLTDRSGGECNCITIIIISVAAYFNVSSSSFVVVVFIGTVALDEVQVDF